MEKQKTFAAIAAANKAVQARARNLNTRAGERVFMALSVHEITQFLVAAMNGARSIEEIPDLDALRFRLCAIEEGADAEGLAARVEAANPDAILALGQHRPVEYRDGAAPRVRLTKEEVLDGALFLELPDEGIRLPGGRAVEVEVNLDYYTTARGEDIAQLKATLRDHVNMQAWSAWTNRPVIQLPDEAADGAVVPEVVEAHYGQCVASGQPLTAYGAVAPNRSRYYSSDPRFKVEWYRTRQEADAARSRAVSELVDLQEKRACAQQELQKARQAAEQLLLRVDELAMQARQSKEVQATVTTLEPVVRQPAAPPSAVAVESLMARFNGGFQKLPPATTKGGKKPR